METKLKPCPFCGSEDVEIEDQKHRYPVGFGDCRITCNDCMARSDIFTNEDGNRIECAISAWNKREGIDVSTLQEEYGKWCEKHSTPGYVYGVYASSVFEFLEEKFG